VRGYRKGSLYSSLTPTQFVGWLEIIAPNATNLDVMVDFGSATYETSTSFFIRFYRQAAPGSGKIYYPAAVDGWRFQPTTGVLGGVAPPGPDWAIQCQAYPLPGSAQFLFHTGERGATVFGVELCAISLTFGAAATNLIVSAIAHGREIWP
jgi:hypothetical protein